MVTRIHTVILTRNEAHNIARAVASARPLGDVTVIDSESGDETVAVARNAGAAIIVHPWPGFAAQRKYALETIAAEWILFLDADEEITPELALEISSIPFDANGYFIRRRSLFLGGWMRHGSWGRDRVMRLFKRSMAHIEDRPVHEEVTVTGTTKTLNAWMLHYSQGDFAEVGRKFTMYVPLMAEEISGRRDAIGGAEIAGRGLSSFARDYILRRGFLDGWRGFVLAFWGMASVVAKYAEARRILETPEREKKSANRPPTI
ncbi:MAG: glycosyltransferase family 2 protein [Candidatus Hydrogenedentota bacterium]